MSQSEEKQASSDNKPKKKVFSKKKDEPGKLKAQCEEYKLGWQRALADYQNLQKEVADRRAEWIQSSEIQIIEEFIPVYENFKQAFANYETNLTNDSSNPEWKNWAEGIGHIMKQFSEVLKAHEVEEIKTVGEKFDPTYHEVTGEEEVEGKASGEIVKELSGGYKMKDKVIRAAKVIIAK